MNKLIAAIGVLVLMLGGVVFALPLALGSDSLRSALSRQLSAAAGAGISLDGPVRFSVFPDFGIVAKDLAYVSGDGSVSVAAARAVASVRVTSLFSDRIRITGIGLQDARITLAKAMAGETAGSPAPEEGADVFQLAASWLDKLAIDRVAVSNGEVFEDDGSGARQLASGIDLGLSVPGPDAPASFAFSGRIGGRQVKLAGEIGSLRDILDRRPAEFSLTIDMAPPPHPALASLGAKGRIQLADDGSYRVYGGEFSSAGRPMLFDASYAPGVRPLVTARIEAGVLDYGDIGPAANTAEAEVAGGGLGGGGGPDLTALRDFDVDFELRADAVQAGDAAARDVVLKALLRNGRLESTLSSQQIAGGRLETDVLADFNGAAPEITGNLDLGGIDIASLTRLAGRDLPASGRLTSRLGYAFRGTDLAAIRSTINLKGVVALEDGVVETPWLAEMAGPGAGHISALDVRTEVTDLEKPLAISGTMDWNDETVAFAASLSLLDLLAGEPGAVAVDLKSQPVEATFKGTVASDGSAKGRAAIAAASLGGLLGWIGRDAGAPPGRFSFEGAIASRAGELSLADTTIALDDMKATGSLSVKTEGRTAITAALSVNALDFARLAGGAGGAEAKPSASAAPAAVDLSALAGFDADISLDADRIGYGKVEAGPAKATLEIKDGVARLVLAKAAFYDGSVAAEVTANGAGKVPAIALEASLTKVDALSFLGDAAGFERIEGWLDTGLSVKGSGATSDALAGSLDGQARVVFSDGAIRGVDVAKMVGNLKSLVTTGYEENAEDRTEFAELSVSFDIADGVARTEDLRLLGPLVRMDGSGSVDVAAQSIDMRLNPRVVGSLDGQGGEFDVAGLGMPVIVEGPLSGPRIYPDLSSILANPEQALETISRLGGGIGGLSTSVSGGNLQEALGKGLGGAAGDVVTGVIGSLDGAGGADAGPNEGPSDLVGNLLKGVLGRGDPADPAAEADVQAALPQPEDQSPFAEPQPDLDPDGEPEADAAPAIPGEDIVLPSGDVPIPTPNPLREASAADLIQQGPDQAGEPLDPVEPENAPEDIEDAAGDLIEGLIRGMGN